MMVLLLYQKVSVFAEHLMKKRSLNCVAAAAAFFCLSFCASPKFKANLFSSFLLAPRAWTNATFDNDREAIDEAVAISSDI